MKKFGSLVSRRPGVRIMFGIAMTAAAGLALAAALPPGPPVVTINGMSFDACGVECTGVKVSWKTAIPAGTTVSGFKVTILDHPEGPGVFESPAPVSTNGKATSAIVPLVVGGTLPSGSYKASVEATYSAKAKVEKTQNITSN